MFMSYMSLLTFTFFLLGLRDTFAAPSNLSFNTAPTSLKFGIVFQQILTEQEPLTP